MALKLRQGLSSDRLSITPASGELIYTTDTKEIYVGDGTTAGGNSISGAIPVNLNSLNDVVITSASSGQVLKFDGANWVNGTDNTGAGSSNLDGLTDVVITSATTGQILKYDGANWINAAETGGGGSMTSFSVTGDDSSTTRAITDGETLNFMGSGSITVEVTASDQIMITNNERVQLGEASGLAFYKENDTKVSSTSPGLVNYNFSTGELFVNKLNADQIFTTEPILQLVNTNPVSSLVLLGGIYDGNEYSANLNVVNVGFEPVFQVHSVFSNYSDTAFCNAVWLQKTRGSIASPANVQTGDFLGTFVWGGYNTDGVYPSSFITTEVEAVGAGRVEGSLTFGTHDGVIPQSIIKLTSKKYAIFGGPITVPPQELDFSSGNITLLYTQIDSNYMYSTGMSTNRDLVLPSPSSTISGLRLCIINKDTTWTITVKYGVTTITTVNALSVKEIYCDGSDWNVLY